MRNSETVVSAFTDEQTARLTGLSLNQLRNWDRTGFFSPSLADSNRRAAFSRIYSFRDLLSLQVLKTLRRDLGVSLQHLRQVKEKLAELGEGSWSTVTIFVLNKRVVFHDATSDTYYEPVDGQRVFKLPLQVVKRNMQSAIDTLWARPDEMIGRVERKKRVAGRKEVLAGTRVSVESVLDFINAGFDDKEIVAEFPSISLEDVDFVRKEYAA